MTPCWVATKTRFEPSPACVSTIGRSGFDPAALGAVVPAGPLQVREGELES